LVREAQGRAVAGEGRVENRAQAGVRSGVRTWPVGRARNPCDGIWPQAEFAVPARIREWALAEVGAGRLMPWFAVAFGAGIVLYFAADHEPAWWAASPLAVVAAIVAVLLRRRPVAFVVGLGVFAVCAGFAVATLKTALIDHSLLHYPGIMAQTPLKSGLIA
jgi:competence protein ComEC